MKRGKGCERQMCEHKRKQRPSEPAVSWPKRIINSVRFVLQWTTDRSTS